MVSRWRSPALQAENPQVHVLTDATSQLCRQGNFLREMSYLPLALDIPVAFNSCRKGPRSLEWRSDKPAELAWIEAQVCTRPWPPNAANFYL